jgi:hypothetical protein
MLLSIVARNPAGVHCPMKAYGKAHFCSCLRRTATRLSHPLERCLDLARGRCQKKVVRWPTLVLAASSVKAGKGTRLAMCGLLAP